ncbi:MAG: hypothetical protein ACTTJV_10415 [Ottowia sp.]
MFKKQANPPQRLSMLRSALSKQEKSVDKSAHRAARNPHETRMKAAQCATAHSAQASRIAPQPSRPRLSDFRLSGFQTARRRLACEIWIQNFAEKSGKPPAAPVNTAQGAIKTGKICG